MKKINITQLENDLLSNREQQELQGGSYWCLCTLYDRDFSDAEFVGGNTPKPGGGGGGGTRPPGPWSCPCLPAGPLVTDYSGDAATAYM